MFQAGRQAGKARQAVYLGNQGRRRWRGSDAKFRNERQKGTSQSRDSPSPNRWRGVAWDVAWPGRGTFFSSKQSTYQSTSYLYPARKKSCHESLHRLQTDVTLHCKADEMRGSIISALLTRSRSGLFRLCKTLVTQAQPRGFSWWLRKLSLYSGIRCDVGIV